MKRLLLALTFFFAAYSLTALKESLRASARAAQTTAAPQKLDDEYTKLIKQYLQDPRITTELVDHMPASDTVPSPLKFFGRIPGTPGELTYSKDINRYYEALAKRRRAPSSGRLASPKKAATRSLLAIADEAHHQGSRSNTRPCSPQLTDPRKTTEEQAQALIHTGEADLLDHQRHPFA